MCEPKVEVCKGRHGGMMAKPANINDSNNEKKLRTFEESYAVLVKYKGVHGHVNVPQSYDGDPKLGKWVNKLRVSYSKSKLSQEKIDKLNQLGFKWSVSRSANSVWQEHYDKLKDSWTENGTCNLPSDEHEYVSMNKWCARQRELFALGKLKPDREMKLRSLGFDWDADIRKPANEKTQLKTKEVATSRPVSTNGPVHLDRKQSGSHNNTSPKDKNNRNKVPADKQSRKKRTKVLGRHNISPPLKRKSPSLEDEVYQEDSDIPLKRARIEPNESQPAEEMSLQNSQANKDAKSPIMKIPPVGAHIRRRYDVGGWFEGMIVDRRKNHYVVRYPEGEDEELSDEETKVSAVAYELNLLSGVPRPQVGDKLRKHYEEGWYEGKVTEQNETESNVLFEDGEVECMTDDELQVCVAAHRMHNAPETCTDYESLCKPLTQRPSVGSKVRKRYKKAKWRNGEIIYQDEKISHIRFDGAKDEVEEISNDELEISALAYEKHNSSLNNRPEVDTKVRKRLVKGWNNGELISHHSAGASRVSLENGEVADLIDEELQATSEAYTLHALKEANGKKIARPSVMETDTEGKSDLPGDTITETAAHIQTGGTSKSTSERKIAKAAVGAVACAADMQIDNDVKETSFPDKKAKRKLVGEKLRRRFEGGWYNGTVVSIDGNSTVIRFEDGEEENLSDSEELRVSIKAHKRQRTLGTERPSEGTKIRKRFEEGWYEGAVIATLDNKKSYILYADGDEEYLSDEEVAVGALAYKMKHSTKKKMASSSAK